jgi:hypothetical protein
MLCVAAQPRLCMNIGGTTKISSIGKWKLSTKDTAMKWLKNIINRIKLEIRYRQKLKELRKRDPFIYK